MRFLSFALIAALCAGTNAVPAQAVLRAQAVGAGAGRSVGPGVIAYSWMGMGIQGGVAAGPAGRVAPGMPGQLTGAQVPGLSLEQSIVELILGRIVPAQVNLTVRGMLDRDGNGATEAADLVRAVNDP